MDIHYLANGEIIHLNNLTENFSNSNSYNNIITEKECRWAAEQLGKDFKESESYYTKGCYYYPNGKYNKVYWNPTGTEAEKSGELTGTKSRISKKTLSSSNIIITEEGCRSAAGQLNRGFEKRDNTKTKGCYYYPNGTDDKVYWNPTGTEAEKSGAVDGTKSRITTGNLITTKSACQKKATELGKTFMEGNYTTRGCYHYPNGPYDKVYWSTKTNSGSDRRDSELDAPKARLYDDRRDIIFPEIVLARFYITEIEEWGNYVKIKGNNIISFIEDDKYGYREDDRYKNDERRRTWSGGNLFLRILDVYTYYASFDLQRFKDKYQDKLIKIHNYKKQASNEQHWAINYEGGLAKDIKNTRDLKITWELVYRAATAIRVTIYKYIEFV